MAPLLCLSVLLFAPRIRLPRAAIGLVLPLSAASYHIYLFHRFAPELILLPLQSALPEPVFTVAAIVSGVAVGLAAYELQKIVVHRLVGATPMLPASDLNSVVYGKGMSVCVDHGVRLLLEKKKT